MKYLNTGGAHPYAFSSSYSYDIENKKDILIDYFVDPCISFSL